MDLLLAWFRLIRGQPGEHAARLWQGLPSRILVPSTCILRLAVVIPASLPLWETARAAAGRTGSAFQDNAVNPEPE